MIRQGRWLLAALAMLSLFGCNCGAPVDERKLVVSFTRPVPGAQLTEADDSDQTRSGLQTDVEVKLEWESLGDGTRSPADLEEAGLALRKNIAGEAFSDAVSGTVAPGGVATFVGVSFLSNGEYQLRATVKELSSHQVTDPLTITINVQNIPNRPQLQTAEIVEDANKDFKVTLAELPVGQQMNLRLTAINFPSGTVTVTNGIGVAVASDFAVADGTGEFIVPISAPPVSTTAIEAQYTFAILLKNAAGLSSSVRPNPPDTLTVAVDQLPPTVELVEPTDKDGGYGTRSLTALANVAGAPGATVQFTSVLESDAGTMDAGTAVVGVNGVATTTVSLFEGRQTLTASVTDLVGNLGGDSVSLTTNTVACNVTLTDPANNTYLGPSQDVSPNDGGFEYAVVGYTTDCPNKTAHVNVGPTLFTAQTDGTGAFSVLVTLQPGANTLSVNVDNGASVFGPPAVADVFVGTTDFRIVAPANNAVLNRSSDLNGSTTGIQSSLNWTGSLPTGSTVTVCASLPAGAGTSPCPDGSSGWIVFAANTPSSAQASYPDGNYQLKAIMVTGGVATSASAPISIRVDSFRPTVATNGIRLQNDANNDLKLNGTEQASGGATVIITTVGMEDGAAVVVKNSATGTTMDGGMGTTLGNTATLTLTTMDGPEADYPLVVELTDSAGNTNNVGVDSAADPRNTDAFVVARVNRVSPTCSLTQPTKTNIGPADDDVGPVPGFQLRVACVSQADIGTVAFSANGSTPVNGTLAGGTVSTHLTIPSSGTTLYNLSATPTDSSGNVGVAATKQVTADFQAPVVTITAPTAAGGPYAQYTLATTVSVPGEDGLTVRMYSTGSAQVIGTLTVVNGTATGPITYPNGTQTIHAEVTDASGNVGVSQSITITVNSTGCSIVLSAPAPGKQFFNIADDLNPTTTPLQLEYTVTGTSSNCANRPVSVWLGTGRTTPLASGTTSGTGAFSLQIALPEGAQHLEVELTDVGNIKTFVSHDATVDLQAPTITAVAPSQTALTFVAATNVNTRGAGTPGYIKDLDPVAPDAQVSLSFTANDANGGKAFIYYLGAQQGAPLDIDAVNDTLSAGVTLAQATAGALEIRVTDAAGNTATHAKTATVDVVPPSTPTFTSPVTNIRAATISLAWPATGNPAVFDDANLSSSGAVTGYDLRWTNSLHVSNGVLTEDDFFNLPTQTPSRLKIETGALLPPTASSYALNVPPLMTTYVLLRAVDDVGNYSPFTPSTSVSNAWPQVAVNNPGPSSFFGWSLAARGDVNADGFGDFVVGAIGSPAPGGAHIFFGKSDAQLLSAQTFGPSDGDTAAQSFGWQVEMGNVSHPASANLTDVVVAAPTFGTNIGRVYLYFGKTGTTFDSSATNAVIFQGTAGLPIGRGISFINDINADGMGELLITSTSENGNRGRVYLFFGRAKASWEGLRSAGTIPMSAADRIIEGPMPVGTGAANNSFAWWRALAPLPSVDSDSVPDFTIATASDSVNKLFVFSGAAVAAKIGSTGTPTFTTGDTPGTPDESLQRLIDLDLGTGGSQNGYGSRVVGGLNLIGSSALDLLVAQPHRSRIHIHPGVASGGPFSSASTKISGGLNFGHALAIGDINGDGRADVLASDSVTGASSAWLFMNSGQAGAEFDAAAGTGFAHTRLNPSSAIGRAAALADINGDNKLDIILTDTTAGRVHVWY